MEFDDNLILSESEIDSLGLFEEDDTGESPEENKEKDTPKTEGEESEVNPDDLFPSESVGNEDDKEDEDKEGKASTSTEADSSSPDTNFYYSITNALVDSGVLPDLTEDDVKGVSTPEDFAEAIEKQVSARLDVAQKRVKEALEANVPVDAVRQYETVINNLNSIPEDSVRAETPEGENLRKNLIKQDLVNRGFSKERIERELKKSFDSGSDVDDALEALAENKTFFKEQYEDLIAESKNKAEEQKKQTEKEAKALKQQMLEDKEIFKGIPLDKVTRQKAYDNVTKAVYKTEEGAFLTAVQKYERENPIEFRKKLGVLFTLTNGFENIDNLIKGKVKKEVKNSLRELEHTLSGVNKPKGNPTFMGGNYAKNPFFDNGWSLDA